MATRSLLPLSARLADVTGVSIRSAPLGVVSQASGAGAAAAAWCGGRHFASSGEGASLRRSADQHLPDGAPESQPRPDSTAINQKAPLSTDDKGKPQVGKVSTPDGADESSPNVSLPEIETDDVIPNLQTPKE